ncbi:Small GTP-binding protein domain [Trinorchestia longiramus]|nr:Small GTP-binding protein domain [Trinorchestia longiramus]
MWSSRRPKENRRNSASIVELQRATKLALSRLANGDRSPKLRRTNSFKENEVDVRKPAPYLKPPYPSYYDQDFQNLSTCCSDTSLRLQPTYQYHTPRGSPGSIKRYQPGGCSSLIYSSTGSLHTGVENRSVKDLRFCEAVTSNDDSIQDTDKKRRGSGVSTPRHPSLTDIPEDFKTGHSDETEFLFSDSSSLASYNTCDFLFKVMLVGDSGVGKTCLVTRFRDGVYLAGNFIATIGVDYRNKTVRVDGSAVRLQVWDTAGQDRFRGLGWTQYKDVHAVMILYDVSNRDSFNRVRNWVAEARRFGKKNHVILLVGNKCDCSESKRPVSKQEGALVARELGLYFLETSAKTGENVELAFKAIALALKAIYSQDPCEKNFNLQDYLNQHESNRWFSCCDSCTIC